MANEHYLKIIMVFGAIAFYSNGERTMEREAITFNMMIRVYSTIVVAGVIYISARNPKTGAIFVWPFKDRKIRRKYFHTRTHGKFSLNFSCKYLAAETDVRKTVFIMWSAINESGIWMAFNLHVEMQFVERSVSFTNSHRSPSFEEFGRMKETYTFLLCQLPCNADIENEFHSIWCWHGDRMNGKSKEWQNWKNEKKMSGLSRRLSSHT